MSVLTAPWFWMGLAIAAGAITLAWLAGHAAPAPAATDKPFGRPPDTKHEHSEFID
jgi:hypothetical protein